MGWGWRVPLPVVCKILESFEFISPNKFPVIIEALGVISGRREGKCVCVLVLVVSFLVLCSKIGIDAIVTVQKVLFYR